MKTNCKQLVFFFQLVIVNAPLRKQWQTSERSYCHQKLEVIAKSIAIWKTFFKFLFNNSYIWCSVYWWNAPNTSLMSSVVHFIFQRSTTKTMYCRNTPKLCLFSTHDSTMTGLLEAFGLWDCEWPPFGANIRIELYRDMNSPEYYVRVLYCGEVRIKVLPFFSAVMLHIVIGMLLGYFVMENLVGYPCCHNLWLVLFWRGVVWATFFSCLHTRDSLEEHGRPSYLLDTVVKLMISTMNLVYSWYLRQVVFSEKYDKLVPSWQLVITIICYFWDDLSHSLYCSILWFGFLFLFSWSFDLAFYFFLADQIVIFWHVPTFCQFVSFVFPWFYSVNVSTGSLLSERYERLVYVGALVRFKCCYTLKGHVWNGLPRTDLNGCATESMSKEAPMMWADPPISQRIDDILKAGSHCGQHAYYQSSDHVARFPSKWGVSQRPF